MPKFSAASFSKLSTCHIDLQTLFFEVVRTFDCTILEGARNQVDQDKAYAAGNSKLKYPFGKHNATPSMAVDVSPYPVDWKNTPRFFWFAGYVLGIAQQLKNAGKITHSVRFGGDWNSNFDIMDEHGLRDMVHFELVE